MRESNRQRLRNEYGSVKAALEYCREMNMYQTEAMRFLAVNSTFIRQWTSRLNIEWTQGAKTSTLSRELASERMTEINRARKGTGRPPYFKQMKPRIINGLLYYPSETAHRCAMQGRYK